MAFEHIPHLPVRSDDTVNTLGAKIVEILKQGQSGEVFGVVPRDFGCEIAGQQAVLRLLVTFPLDQPCLQLDPQLHLSREVLAKNMAALRHAFWFDDNAGQPAVRVLVRLVKDVRNRAAGLKALDVWTIELLVSGPGAGSEHSLSPTTA